MNMHRFPHLLRLQFLCGFVLAAALFSAGVCATDIEPPEDAGLPVGRVAPDFSLTGQDGKQVSLASLLKKGPVAVVFHRSADWCLYCKLQMVQLQGISMRSKRSAVRSSRSVTIR